MSFKVLTFPDSPQYLLSPTTFCSTLKSLGLVDKTLIADILYGCVGSDIIDPKAVSGFSARLVS